MARVEEFGLRDRGDCNGSLKFRNKLFGRAPLEHGEFVKTAGSGAQCCGVEGSLHAAVE